MKKNLFISDFSFNNWLIILSTIICLLILFIINLLIIKTAMVNEAQRITNNLVLKSDAQFIIMGDSNAESALTGNYYENYINISFSKKNLAKTYGARWDSTVKKWYYLDSLDENNIIKLKNLI